MTNRKFYVEKRVSLNGADSYEDDFRPFDDFYKAVEFIRSGDWTASYFDNENQVTSWAVLSFLDDSGALVGVYSTKGVE